MPPDKIFNINLRIKMGVNLLFSSSSLAFVSSKSKIWNKTHLGFDIKNIKKLKDAGWIISCHKNWLKIKSKIQIKCSKFK